MKTFCKRKEKNSKSTKFVYHGKIVNDNDTPESLEIGDGDVIEATFQQTGGHK